MIMDLGDLVSLDGVIASLRARNKKQALQELSARAAIMTGVPARDIFDAAVQRERLGSTGLGRGIAIPHVKLPALTGITCLFARLDDPIDFDAHDDAPVDLIFFLLAPDHASGDHLRALARISRLMRESAVLEQLRAASGAASLQAILAPPAMANEAA